MTKKLLYLFVLVAFFGAFAACNDDDDNNPIPPEPEPTPEINNAREVEGLYGLNIIITSGDTKDTSEQKINLTPQGKDFVKLKTSYIKFKVNKQVIGNIEIDSIPVATENGHFSFIVQNGKATLTKLGDAKATVNGSIVGKDMELTLAIQASDWSINLDCNGLQKLNDQALITRMTFQSDVVLSQPEISETDIIFYVKPGLDAKSLQLAPVLELSKGAIVKPGTAEIVDFSGALNAGDATKYVEYIVISENFKITKTYKVSYQIGTDVSKTSFDDAWTVESAEANYYKPAGEWATSNLGIVMIKIFPGLYEGGAIIEPTPEGQKGKAAKITTAYTTGYPSILGFPTIPVITSGSLFLGRFEIDMSNTLNSTRFGIPYFKKPLKVKGFYKYTPGEKYYFCADPNNSNIATIDPNKTDEGVLRAVLYEVSSFENEWLNGMNVFTSDKIVAKSQMICGKQEGFKEFELNLEYNKTYDPTKKYRFAVIFSSSKDGDKFSGAGGSVLVVDEIEIIDE